MKIAVSACLVGQNTKYDGKNNYNQAVIDYLKDKEYILICPEVTGGLPTPRVPSERVNNKIINKEGIDVTKNFINGAVSTINMLIKEKVDTIIVKEKSPSCGYKKIYDGTFTNKLVDGHGVFVELAIKNKFKILTEKDLENKKEKN